MENLTTQHALLPTQKEALSTLSTAQSLINKCYLGELKHYDVLLAEDQREVQINYGGDVRIFRVERIVQENKQAVLESTTAAYTALGAAGYTVFLFLKSNGKETFLYIGTRGQPGKMLGQNSGDLLEETFKGHFPGSKLSSLDVVEVNELLKAMSDESPSKTVTAVSSVPAMSTIDQEHFVQGLERFIDAAENRTYEGMILAEPVSMQALNTVRTGYEQIATQLSALSKRQYSYGIQDSEAISLSISEGLSQSLGKSLGLTETTGSSESTSSSISDTESTNTSESSPDLMGQLIGLGGVAIGAGLAGPIGAVIGSQVTGAFQKTITHGTSKSHATSESTSHSTNHSTATNQTTTHTDTNSTTNTQGLSQTRGASRQVSFEVADKGILGMLDKIDHHLQRIDEAKSHGGWLNTAYFISDSAASSEALASIFLGLTRGQESSTEDFALTTWSGRKANAITQWLGQLMHPRLEPAFAGRTHIPYLTPATLVSSKEMAIQLSLPRRSTSTVVVQDATAFGRKVLSLNQQIHHDDIRRTIELGKIRHLWTDLSQDVQLDLDQLSGHTLVTGSTGSGKSNTVYSLLDKLHQQRIPFLVIEPAKGEYKHVVGQHPDVRVLGTNSKFTELLRINPFSFPPQTHVYEHIDRLVEVFNVCWPMYAAMPAILKDAMLRSYEACGWNLNDSTTSYLPSLFPTFADLLVQLELVIEQSAYSAENKSNYTGALVTRVRSMVNGLNGLIFSADEINNTELFDHNVIVDLSRVGSQETKSLIMGLLVIKLGEYRAELMKMNQPLQHVTVLEEAHHILRANISSNGTDGGSVAEKSVEMLSNAIAEMRTYGEGFIIADQSPSAIHISAIRNTNTKVIMRLPEEADRYLAGKSAALSNEQIDELAKLPTGVAVVYQNEWLEAVLCKVNHFSYEVQPYTYRPKETAKWDEETYRTQCIQWLLSPRCKQPLNVHSQDLSKELNKSNLPTQIKLELITCLSGRSLTNRLPIHDDNQFIKLSELVIAIWGCEQQLIVLITEATDIPTLHNTLQQFILKRMGEISDAMAITIEQCFLKSLSIKGKLYLDLYNAWNAYITKDVA
ncbi:ATP-binding protein [Shewanella mangrovi]|uniref:ATP-binding protein n=1 Tax=Shewanella mangrovi TaxID=1515746 RepID=A0A094JFS2_9GAMM|nr:ATP-binding protein [Shewanella mangrovi]